MLKRVDRAEHKVEHYKRLLCGAQAELEAARKRVTQVGGTRAAERLDAECRAEKRLERSLASTNDLRLIAWKWVDESNHDPLLLVRCDNPDCMYKDGMVHRQYTGHYRCRWGDQLALCDICIDNCNLDIDWEGIIAANRPNLEQAWREQALLPRYADETKQNTVDRATDSKEWIESRRAPSSGDTPLCAMSYEGYTAECVHGDSTSFFALRGAPGMALCSQHFPHRHDTELMRRLLSFVVWGNAVGLENTNTWVLIPQTKWALCSSWAALNRCVKCNEPADHGGCVEGWWGAVRIMAGQFVWACAPCYVRHREPRCSMCNEPTTVDSSGHFQVNENVLEHTCAACL